MYKVVKMFLDLQDGSHEYNIGDVYPRKGYEPSAERVAELSGGSNAQGCPLIEVTVEEKPTKRKAPR